MGSSVSRVGAQSIDNQLLKPKVVKCLEERRLKRYIVQGKLAPCYEGQSEEDSNSFQYEECPICFLNFPALNEAECCNKRICTECFLQVSGRTCLVSDVVCPFCKAPNFAVKFTGPRSKEEQLKEWEENQKAVAAEISASQNREQPLFSEEEINAVRRGRTSSNSIGGGSSSSGGNRSRHRNRPPQQSNAPPSNNNSSTAAVQVNSTTSQTNSTANNNATSIMPPHPLWMQVQSGILDMGNNMQRMNLIGGGDQPPGILELCRDLGMSLEEINELLLEHAIASSVMQLTQSGDQSGVDRTETQQQELQATLQGGIQQDVQHEEEQDDQVEGQTGLRHRNVQEEQPQSNPNTQPTHSTLNPWDNEVSGSLHLNQQSGSKLVQQITKKEGQNSLETEILEENLQQDKQQQIQQQQFFQQQQQQQSSSSTSSFTFPTTVSQPNLVSSDRPILTRKISKSAENLNTLEIMSDNQQQSNIFQNYSSELVPVQLHDSSSLSTSNNNNNNNLSAIQSDEIQIDNQNSDFQCSSNSLAQQENQTQIQESEIFHNEDEQIQFEMQNKSDSEIFLDVGDLEDVENPPEAIIVDLPDNSSVLGLLLVNDKIVAQIVSVDEDEAFELCPSISFVRDERDQAVQVVIARGDESVRQQIERSDNAVQRATQSTYNYLERLRRLDDEFKARLEQMDRVVQRNFQ